MGPMHHCRLSTSSLPLHAVPGCMYLSCPQIPHPTLGRASKELIRSPRWVDCRLAIHLSSSRRPATRPASMNSTSATARRATPVLAPTSRPRRDTAQRLPLRPHGLSSPLPVCSPASSSQVGDARVFLRLLRATRLTPGGEFMKQSVRCMGNNRSDIGPARVRT